LATTAECFGESRGLTLAARFQSLHDFILTQLLSGPFSFLGLTTQICLLGPVALPDHP